MTFVTCVSSIFVLFFFHHVIATRLKIEMDMNMKNSVLLILSLSIILFSLTSRAYSNAATVEKTEVDLFDEVRNRPHKITIWYPSNTNKSCLDSLICLSKNTNADIPQHF